jgi:erythromycin esterase
LREFNEDRHPDERVRVYGFDAQYTTGAVERLRVHLDAGGVGIPDEVAADLDVVDDEGDHSYQAEGVPERVEAVERVAPRLRTLLDDHREDLVAATSGRAHERARRYVAVLEQAAAYAEANDAMDPDADDRSEQPIERVMRVRDRNMADNVEWLLDRVDAEPLVLWAHDAHLVRTEQVDRTTGIAATSLGGHLAGAHGEDYFAVGFSFARGAFQAMSEGDDGEYDLREQHLDGPLPDTVDATLAELGEELAFVDLRTAARDDAVVDWLAQPRPHFSVGGSYDDGNPTEYLTEYTLGEAFDAVCFVEETTRARPLEGDEE